ncbi:MULTISPECIES: hypothetical protein [Streptomyces]|uniref:hypothetical protein n=1 Tax=Streptomyces TaxID=1883 RepID=UPI0009A4F6A3|nr:MULTISPECIES: hypothetical protein [Streptomyces]
MLRLQHYFDGLLDPDGPKEVGSFGWLIPAAQYFVDLRAVSALIFMTWPRAREFADVEALAVLVDQTPVFVPMLEPPPPGARRVLPDPVERTHLPRWDGRPEDLARTCLQDLGPAVTAPDPLGLLQ